MAQESGVSGPGADALQWDHTHTLPFLELRNLKKAAKVCVGDPGVIHLIVKYVVREKIMLSWLG